jgi:hypothetical protein
VEGGVAFAAIALHCRIRRDRIWRVTGKYRKMLRDHAFPVTSDEGRSVTVTNRRPIPVSGCGDKLTAWMGPPATRC